MNPSIRRLATLAAVLAFCVIVLGAWVRLSHAGLGCPDWPGCYGELTWPQAHEIDSANEAFPERPVEVHKAWKEMVHRYVAGVLVLLVAWLTVRAWRDRSPQRGLAAALMAFILFQAALGMWTVTLKLKPIIVMAHLLGGMTTFSLLVWIALRSGRPQDRSSAVRAAKPWVVVALLVAAVQIALGGWTSANYAALVCPDLPTCMGQWWPEHNFTEGFRLWREIGVDYEGGVLDLPSRVAIHLTHRIGAVVTFLVMMLTAWRLARSPVLRRGALALLAVTTLQVTLGVLNISLYLTLPNAVAHNGGAALLLATLVWLLHRTTPQTR